MSAIALDGMGGDFAPRATAEGAVRAAASGIEVALVGDEAVLRRELDRLGGVSAGVRLVHAPDTIAMEEHASLETRRRRESSIYIAMELVKSGQAEAFVSLGNTGAVLALALVVLGRLPGVERPALSAVLPRPGQPVLLLDIGANVEARASHLVQWARLGTEYTRAVLGVADPSVGLLNIGAEATKGSPLTIQAHAELSASSPRFAGNVEGRDLLMGDVDVVVTDGFTGNVALKAMEGTVALMFGEMRKAAANSLRARIGGQLMRPALTDIRRRLDYRRYGGVPLLGVNGIVMIGHGSSDAEAVTNAVGAAATAARQRMLEVLASAVEGLRSPGGGA